VWIRQPTVGHLQPVKDLGITVDRHLDYSNHIYRGGSVAEWLACWTRAQKGPGSNRSRDAVG